ncbi:MAG TPA: YiiX/YebB-like N1pC/P60 family cysteine hydrolase [Pseudorhodoplanes sp.]|nr:YiiX/YebB-like N1pC/P60 family cysteine hydrolase [Pseudorhodoplanes sp.]
MFDTLRQRISAAILHYLSKPTKRYAPFFAPDIEVIREALQPGDVILVEGNTRLSAIIKFLTQSTWSHAALVIGERPSPDGAPHGEPHVLLEAEADTGVTTAPLSKYAHYNLRICRPVGLGEEDRGKVVSYAVARLGKQYDSKQIVDLARYLFPYPPVPVWFRRRMLAIGAGDPTKAICSTLIAEAFASIRYPILPESKTIKGRTIGIAPFVQRETDHIRRHGLYTPRDFDISPYFQIIKPALNGGFDYHALQWDAPSRRAEAARRRQHAHR